MKDYQPIPCVQHERLEFSILRRLALHLDYLDDGVPRREKVKPLDVYTRGGAEWLKFLGEDSAEREIRLDCIKSFQETSA